MSPDLHFSQICVLVEINVPYLALYTSPQRSSPWLAATPQVQEGLA